MVAGLLLVVDLASLKLGISMLQRSKLDTACILVHSHQSIELPCMLPTFFTSHEILEILMCV